MSIATPLLFSPYTNRETTFPNRLVLAPMMQYMAKDGFASDWHLAHFGKFALGGFGAVMTEVVAVSENGRITYGDMGLWSDAHIPGMKRFIDFIHSQHALAAIQLGHSGRKGSTQRPWEGGGPLTAADALRGDSPWMAKAPSAVAFDKDYPPPEALTIAEIETLVEQFGQAAARADQAGYDIVEIHGAHGYLISSFLSPITNQRQDAYGGDLARRMKFALDIATSVRKNWPAHKPLFFRISAVDGGGDAGWKIEDSLTIAPLLAERGVDIIDCSSGGIQGAATVANSFRGLNYQVPYADQIKNIAKVSSMAVGIILTGKQAEEILQSGKADLIAIGRQALYDPYWPLHARQELNDNPNFDHWEETSAWWMRRRASSFVQLGLDAAGKAIANKANSKP